MLEPQSNTHVSAPKPAPMQAAKWPPDDSDLPSGNGAGSSYGYGGGDDGNFRRGRFRPVAIVVGIAIVALAGVVAVFAIKGEGEKMGAEDAAKQKKELAQKPKQEALPKWREWAKRDDAPSMQQEAFAHLAWSKDQEGLGSIIKGVTSSDKRVSGTAATALLEYGTPAADAAKPALLEALKSADNSNKPQVAWALAALHEQAAFDDVLAEYKLGHLAKVQRLDQSPAFDPELLAGMVSLDKLATLAGDSSESVRQLVATILSRTGDAKWTAALTKLVADPSVEVAREAAVGLGKIANEESMNPLLAALMKADKDSRQKFLEALRDGVGSRGILLALKTVSKETYEREKFQTKQLFDMIRELADPRGADLLVDYIASNPRPHWKTEAAFRLAEIGDLRAVPALAWRLRQDTPKLYNAAEDPDYRNDATDSERVISARYLADLAILYPDKRPDILRDAEDAAIFWATDRPQPHANVMRFLAAAGSKKALPLMRKWANPSEPLPKPGQPDFPQSWATAQSGLRYLGWAKDPESWGLLEKQLNRRPPNVDVTMSALLEGGLAVLGMTLRGLAVGASHGFAQWGDPKAYPILVKHIEDTQANEQGRREACFALAWVATEENMKEVVNKVKQFHKAGDPKASEIRACYLETLIRRPVPSATANLMELIRPDIELDVRFQAARAMGFGGLTPAMVDALTAKLKDTETRTDAALALLIGADPDVASRAIASFDDAGPEAMEQLKVVYNQSFGYWSDKNLEEGALARWIANAEAAGHVKVKDSLQDWPKMILTRALQGIEFDNGPRSMTRVQLRMRLLGEAKGADEAKRKSAIGMLKFMKEKGVLMTLKGQDGPWKEMARQAFFEVMNPKISGERIPEAQSDKR